MTQLSESQRRSLAAIGDSCVILAKAGIQWRCRVIPAKAGIQFVQTFASAMDLGPGLRRDDDLME